MNPAPDLSVPARPASFVPRPPIRWKSRLLLPLLIFALAGGLLFTSARDLLEPRVAVRVAAVVPVPTAVQGEGDSDDSRPEVPNAGPVVQAPGWIEPSPFATIVPALADGVVREVRVLEGDRVEAGQVVATLVDDDAKLAVATQEALVAERRAAVASSIAAARTARVQADVERAAIAELQDELDRKRPLVDAGGIAAGEVRRLELRMVGLQARVAAADLATAEADARRQEAQAALHSAEAVLRETELRLARMQIISPVAGVVLARLVTPGTRLSMDAAVTEAGGMHGGVIRVYDPDRLQVRVDVPLADAAKIAPGIRAEVVTEALPETTFEGTVTRLVHEANIQRNTVQCKVAIDRPSPLLKPEMLARVKLHPAASSSPAGPGSDASDVEGTAVCVPTSALIEGSDGRRHAWLVDLASGKARATRREVKVGPSPRAGFASVRAGLSLTDRVVLDPPPTLTDGTRLEPVDQGPATGVEP